MALGQYLSQLGVNNFEFIDWGWTTTVVFDQKGWFTLTLKLNNIEKGLTQGMKQYKRQQYQQIVSELIKQNPDQNLKDFNCHGPLVLNEPDDA